MVHEVHAEDSSIHVGKAVREEPEADPEVAVGVSSVASIAPLAGEHDGLLVGACEGDTVASVACGSRHIFAEVHGDRRKRAVAFREHLFLSSVPRLVKRGMVHKRPDGSHADTADTGGGLDGTLAEHTCV